MREFFNFYSLDTFIGFVCFEYFGSLCLGRTFQMHAHKFMFSDLNLHHRIFVINFYQQQQKLIRLKHHIKSVIDCWWKFLQLAFVFHQIENWDEKKSRTLIDRLPQHKILNSEISASCCAWKKKRTPTS